MFPFRDPGTASLPVVGEVSCSGGGDGSGTAGFID
jgi:hypothetical protein